MKKILIVFCAILFASCTGVETSIFTDDNIKNNITKDVDHQFIVGEIQRTDDNNCKYIDRKTNDWFSECFSNKASFVAKKGLFQIGDTVTVCKFTKK